MTKQRNVLILGESPLVEEYSALCHNKGFAVTVRTNQGKPAPKGSRRGTRITRSFGIALELTNTDPATKKQNLIELDRGLAAATTIISSSVTVTVSEQATWIARPERLVGIGALPTILQRNLVEIASSATTAPAAFGQAKEFVRSLDKEWAGVQDSVGLVLPRIVCALINEACFAMMENVAAGHDIDTAMKLGTNYPHGPVEWGEAIGPRHVLAVMDALHRFFGESRYRPAPLLRRAANRNSFS
jgi:3-hydroxybutyryl-CoA dehydrogenase